MKSDNSIIKDKLKKKQTDLEKLLKDLNEKKDQSKLNTERIRSSSRPSMSNICENPNLSKNDNSKYIQLLKKSLKNTENQSESQIVLDFDKRKTSFSTVSGSIKSGPSNSIKNPIDFNELMSDKNKKIGFENLSEKEREIYEYFQQKLNEKNNEVNYLQNQIKTLMEKNLPEKQIKTDRNNYYFQNENNNIKENKPSFIPEAKTDRSKIERNSFLYKNSNDSLLKTEELSKKISGKSKSPLKKSKDLVIFLI